jgi:hypothetical protein
MTINEFKNSLKTENPPTEFSSILKALWYDAKGSWNAAHELVDGGRSIDAVRVHAYLHRKEGDNWNANYW